RILRDNQLPVEHARRQIRLPTPTDCSSTTSSPDATAALIRLRPKPGAQGTRWFAGCETALNCTGRLATGRVRPPGGRVAFEMGIMQPSRLPPLNKSLNKIKNNY